MHPSHPGRASHIGRLQSPDTACIQQTVLLWNQHWQSVLQVLLVDGAGPCCRKTSTLGPGSTHHSLPGQLPFVSSLPRAAVCSALSWTLASSSSSSSSEKLLSSSNSKSSSTAKLSSRRLTARPWPWVDHRGQGRRLGGAGPPLGPRPGRAATCLLTASLFTFVSFLLFPRMALALRADRAMDKAPFFRWSRSGGQRAAMRIGWLSRSAQAMTRVSESSGEGEGCAILLGMPTDHEVYSPTNLPSGLAAAWHSCAWLS